MVAATDSEDSSLQVGPPRQAASPQPTSPSAVSRRTKTNCTASSVVKDILWGRATGMSAWITRTLAIFMQSCPREWSCSRPEDAGFGVDAPGRKRLGDDASLCPLAGRRSSAISAGGLYPQAGRGGSPWVTASWAMRNSVVVSDTGRAVAAWMCARYGGTVG